MPIPLIEVLKFDSEYPSLNRIQPSVITLNFMVIFSRLPVIAQHLYPSGNVLIVSGYRASFPTRTQIFPRIKTERGHAPDGTRSLPPRCGF